MPFKIRKTGSLFDRLTGRCGELLRSIRYLSRAVGHVVRCKWDRLTSMAGEKKREYAEGQRFQSRGSALHLQCVVPFWFVFHAGYAVAIYFIQTTLSVIC